MINDPQVRGAAAARPSQRYRPGSTTPGRAVKGSRRPSRRFLVLLLFCVVVPTTGVVALRSRRNVVDDPVRPRTVEPFVLEDARGRAHTPADWRDATAVVVFVIATECPVSNGYAPEMRRLAERYGAMGVLFLGVHPDPAVSREVAARHAEEYRLSFPVLLDPAQELTGALGARVTPEAAVLDSQGHVLYCGRIDDRVTRDGRRRETPRRFDLEEAILAAIVGDAPEAARVEAFGCPLPPAAPAVAANETITFNTHVAPIVWERCASCHHPGQVGPFSLLTYRDAAKRSDFLRDITASRRMPPWRAVHGFGDFHDSPRLSRRELAILARWAEDGAPEGEPAARRDPPRFSERWSLGTPDLVLTMSEPFVPAVGGDTYRAFILPIPLDRDTAIAALEFRPGNRRLVHHARFFVDPSREYRERDAADSVQGFTSFGEGDIRKPGLGAWVPGLRPQMPPPGVGKVMRKGSDLIVLIHYHGSGKEEADRSSVGLFFCKTPPSRTIVPISLSSAKIDIPPGAKRHRIAATRHVAGDSHAISVLPHGHFLMREISLTATLPSGRVVPMLWIDDWDFYWQGQYHFARPLALPRGTRLDLVAYYDNSAENPANPNDPPRRVRCGWASTDEMLGCHVQVIADDDEAQRTFDRTQPLGL